MFGNQNKSRWRDSQKASKLRRETYCVPPPLLVSPDGGIHRRHQNWPKPGAKRKEIKLVAIQNSCLGTGKKKAIWHRCSSQRDLKRDAQLTSLHVSKTRTPNIPILVHIQDIEEVNAAVNADESVEVNSQVSMICLLIGSSKTKSKYHENIRKQ